MTHLDNARKFGSLDGNGRLLVERLGDFGVPDTFLGPDALEDSQHFATQIALHLSLLKAVPGVEQVKVDAVGMHARKISSVSHSHARSCHIQSSNRVCGRLFERLPNQPAGFLDILQLDAIAETHTCMGL